MPAKGEKHSEETRLKMSISRRKRPPISEETRARMRVAASKRGPISEETRAKLCEAGRKKTLSPEHRAKISASHIGMHHTIESRSKISKNHIDFSGKNHPMYGKHHTEKSRMNMSRPHPNATGKNHRLYGTHLTNEQKSVISMANRGRHPSEETLKKLSAATKGENNPRWKGGISFEPYCPKFNAGLKQRIREFFENRCVMCGEKNVNGRALCCHHVTYNKEMCCDGKPVRFAALCIRCHNKTSAGDRQRWENMLHRAIDEIWDGKSYFTKEEYARFEFGESG